MRSAFALATVVLLSTILAVRGTGSIIVVYCHASNCSLSAVSSAAKAARSGDRIMLQDGIWKGCPDEGISIKHDNVTISGSIGPGYTTIDCEFSGTPFYFYSGGTIIDLTFNNTGSEYAAVVSNANNLTIIGCSFNHGRAGCVSAHQVTVTNSSFFECTVSSLAKPDGSAIYAEGNATILFSSFTNIVCPVATNGNTVVHGSSFQNSTGAVSIANCDWANVSDSQFNGIACSFGHRCTYFVVVVIRGNAYGKMSFINNCEFWGGYGHVYAMSALQVADSLFELARSTAVSAYGELTVTGSTFSQNSENIDSVSQWIRNIALANTTFITTSTEPVLRLFEGDFSMAGSIYFIYNNSDAQLFVCNKDTRLHVGKAFQLHVAGPTPSNALFDCSGCGCCATPSATRSKGVMGCMLYPGVPCVGYSCPADETPMAPQLVCLSAKNNTYNPPNNDLCS